MDLSKKTASKVEDKAEVHSANSWETADLGDEGRNTKFLRLMGAKKKEHHGRFVIGDQEASAHKRQKDDEKVIAEELADQYEQGMEHRLVGGKKGHLGLGYHPELSEEEDAADEVTKEADAAEKEADDAAEKEADEEEKEAEDQERSEGDGAESDEEERSHKKDERKREVEEDESDHDKKKMKFVKSIS